MTIKEFYEWAVKHDAEIVIDSGKNKKPNGVRIIV